MNPNWFIGLVANPADWFPRRLGEVPPGIRLFSPDDLHLTVAFLGGCSESDARAAWSHAAEWPLPVTRIALGDVVPMGPASRYSALSALLLENRQAVQSAISEVRGDMWQAAAARPDRRPAKAHLTLARLNRGATPAQRDGALSWAASIDIRGLELYLDRLSLYTWRTDRSKGLFKRVETLQLPAEKVDRQ